RREDRRLHCVGDGSFDGGRGAGRDMGGLMVGGRAHVTWAFPPIRDGRHCAAYVHRPAEFQWILEHRTITVDGQPADLVDANDPNLTDPASGFMTLQFRQPFDPRPRLLAGVTPPGAPEPVLLEATR